MKKLLFLLVFLPFVAFGQDKYAPSKENKWGVGLGYRFGTVLADSINPFEITLQYRIKGKHTIYASFPFRYKRGFDDSWKPSEKYDDTNPYRYKGDNKTWNNLQGLEIGYNYNLYLKKGFSVFGGSGLEYLRYKCGYEYEIFNYEYENITYKELMHHVIKKDAYSLIPHIGLRYAYKHIEGEVRYSLYLSYIHQNYSDYVLTADWGNEYNQSSENIDFAHLDHEFQTRSSFSFKLSYYF